MDTGDTAFVMICSALVMFMTPGLALFYGGMVRKKNVLAMMMQSFIVIGLVSVIWVLWGYSLAFGPDIRGIIGSLKWFGLKGVGPSPNPEYAGTIPHQAFMIFQAMFAIITPALITGAFAERMKFSTFLIFILLWSTLVYSPIVHWVWGIGGWLGNMGALDFAGGTVVHVSSGASALAAALLISKRKGYGKDQFIPHNLPMTITGAAVLWFGWFGFNAGSALGCNGLAVGAFVATHVAAAAAALVWMAAEWVQREKPSTLGAASGVVAGLVAITPAAGFVGPMSALIIGGLAGVICYAGILFKSRLGYDDSLDVVGIHGLGGIWGAVATGFFASKTVNPNGANGLFFGNPGQLWVQFISVLVTSVFAFVMTVIIFKVLDWTIGLRVSDEDEIRGLDITQHSETAYEI
nr:ammonium transporter [Desulfobacterales bacterium]